MAVLKRKVNSEAKGFSPYAGEDPKPGVYRARIIKASIRAAKTGRLAYNVFYELAATKPEAKKYDGYTGFCEIYLGDETEEWAQAGESAFVKAITGKSNFQTANVAFTGKEEDFETVSGAPMTAIDGTKIENKIVNVNLRMEKEREHDGTKYPAELRARGILPWAKSELSDDDDEADDVTEADEDEIEDQEADEPEEGDEEEGEEMSDEEWEAAKEARRVELKSRAFGLDKLKETLTEQGVDIKGMKKPEMVEAIIALEFPDDEEDGDEDAEGIDETDVEVDEDAEEGDDEDEDDEEEEEDEDDEEGEDEDLETELRAEAAELDRTALKKEIKALDADAGFKKSETDDDLRERLVELKLNQPGF